MTHDEYRIKKADAAEKLYREVFKEYCSYVHTIVFSILRSCASREDIEECTADIFSDIYRYYDCETERDGDIKGFIGVVARRKALKYYARLTSHGKDISLDDDELFEEIKSDDDVEETVTENETQKIIIEKIKELGEPDSTIIIQKYFYNRTAGEIARIVSMPQTSVRVRCFRALKKMKKILSDTGMICEEQ